MGRTLRLVPLMLLAPIALRAQGTDSIRTAIPLPVTDSALRLPADRASDLISWIPGGSVDIDGRAAWRGRSNYTLDRSVDGIGWGSLVRSAGANGDGAQLRRFEPALNAIGSAALYHGAYDVDRPAGGPGLLGYTTLGGGTRWSMSGTAESEEPLESDGGPGVSRFEASAGGPLLAGWRARVAATITGRQSAVTGVGYGDNAYFVPNGIDTTLTYPVPPGPVDSLTASVQTFGTTTSVPYSPRTTTDLFGRVDGSIGKVALWGRYLYGGDDERFFTYTQVSNNAQTFVRNGRTQDLGVGASTDLGAWRIDATLAWQEERAQEGPLDLASEPGTRDPSLGILKDGVDLLFNMGNFPVDDELLWNYRFNRPGSRRSPYDLENTAQYSLIDQYRNNAYGLLGFSEAGGPVGRLNLYRDRRTALNGSVSHAFGGGALEVGGELRKHDIQYYSHQLTSQAYSDIWLTKPTEQALYAKWSVGARTWHVAAGLRMDRFNTGARRPRMVPRLSSYNQTYVDTATGDTLRWAMSDVADSAEWYLKNTVADQAHVTWSPRLSAEGELGAGWIGHASVGRLARTPDLATQLTGINTDLAITNTAQIWGTDYGHEVTDLIEVGLRFQYSHGWADLTGFRENERSTPVTRLYSVYDPATQKNVDLRQTKLLAGPVNSGFTLSGMLDPITWLRLSGSYTHFFDGDEGDPFDPFGEDPFRHNTLILTATAAPTTGSLKGFGTILSWRQATGKAAAIPTNPFDFWPETEFRTAGMPAWKSLDLRITKSFAMAGSTLSVYLNARNLLNTENLLHAFDTGDPKRSDWTEADRWSSDSNDYAREASASGKYNGGSGNIDLTFGGAADPRAACGGWVTAANYTNPVNCVYLIGAEERFGNGDHTFSLAEQQAASMAYYRTQLGTQALTGPPQTLRIGAQIGF